MSSAFTLIDVEVSRPVLPAKSWPLISTGYKPAGKPLALLSLYFQERPGGWFPSKAERPPTVTVGELASLSEAIKEIVTGSVVRWVTVGVLKATKRSRSKEMESNVGLALDAETRLKVERNWILFMARFMELNWLTGENEIPSAVNSCAMLPSPKLCAVWKLDRTAL